MKINIPESELERIVIIGGGFAGLNLAKKLVNLDYQVVMIDKNNFHQFQPLFYQVAMAGLEPSSIVFPLRKYFQGERKFFFRVTEVTGIELEKNRLQTPLGIVNYDHLVLATGADTNYFGNERLSDLALPMKSVSEALFLRNKILEDYEQSLSITNPDDRKPLIDIVVVGGGPTGTEVSGALAEMRRYVLPKDYPELNTDEIDIHLIEGADRLLPAMSEKSSAQALKFLTELGVQVKLNTFVQDYDGETIFMNDGTTLRAKKVIWAAGVRGNMIDGFPDAVVAKGNRLAVDRYFRVHGFSNIYAIGDIAYMEEENYPKGHPQVAQVAIQHGKQLSKNFKLRLKNKPEEAFSYNDPGTMATIGRNRAVVDLPKTHFSGTFAWFVWLFVHLYALLGARNRVVVFINWVWNYLTYDQSLRLIIRPVVRKKDTPAEVPS